MFSYFLKGGFMMWPLLICSLVAVALIIERFFFYRSVMSIHRLLYLKIARYLQRGEVREAVSTCQEEISLTASVMEVGLSSQSQESAKLAIDDAIMLIVPKMERFLPIIAIIASVSTLLGFTGTVIGMIKAFEAIVREGVSSPTVVASGVGQALITTAFGLLIAIPTLVAHQYFTYRLDRFMMELEQNSRTVNERTQNLAN